MTEREKMLRGEMYAADDPELHELRVNARRLVAKLARTPISKKNARSKILSRLLGGVGDKFAYAEDSFKVDYGCNVYVGKNFYANFDCVLLDTCKITIGDNCMLAPKVAIYTATHPLNAAERTSGFEYGKPVSIGDNCWLGGGCVINPGVVLGDNTVVASGSVVTKSFPDGNVLIGGNPARILKEIPL